MGFLKAARKYLAEKVCSYQEWLPSSYLNYCSIRDKLLKSSCTYFSLGQVHVYLYLFRFLARFKVVILFLRNCHIDGHSPYLHKLVVTNRPYGLVIKVRLQLLSLSQSNFNISSVLLLYIWRFTSRFNVPEKSSIVN